MDHPDESDSDRIARMEKELQREKSANRELRDRLTAVLANERERGTFLALVAHQLKGPILPLMLSLETIARADKAGKRLPADTIPRALRQVHRLTRLIDSLLVDLAQVEAGELKVTASVFDLRGVVDETMADFRRLFEGRTFDVKLPESPVEVRCDVERVRQIVTSLVENAVKYSPPEAPIEVALAVEGTEAVLSVGDGGIGIPAMEHSHVFTKFFRASNAPSYLYKGLGVGLFLSHEVAVACHGRMWFESEPNRGSTFHVAFPCALQDGASSRSSEGACHGE